MPKLACGTRRPVAQSFSSQLANCERSFSFQVGIITEFSNQGIGICEVMEIKVFATKSDDIPGCVRVRGAVSNRRRCHQKSHALSSTGTLVWQMAKMVMFFLEIWRTLLTFSKIGRLTLCSGGMGERQSNHLLLTWNSTSAPLAAHK